jgi:hypothetical protein
MEKGLQKQPNWCSGTILCMWRINPPNMHKANGSQKIECDDFLTPEVEMFLVVPVSSYPFPRLFFFLSKHQTRFEQLKSTRIDIINSKQTIHSSSVGACEHNGGRPSTIYIIYLVYNLLL